MVGCSRSAGGSLPLHFAPADVPATEAAWKVERVHGAIGVALRFGDGAALGCDIEHPAAGSGQAIPVTRGTGLEHASAAGFGRLDAADRRAWRGGAWATRGRHARR